MNTAGPTRDSFNIPDLPRHNMLVRIALHRAEGGGLTFGDHFFQLDIQCGALAYQIERSYVDFVDLDLKLRKTFPKNILDKLPLESYDVIAKYLKKEHTNRHQNTSDRRQSLAALDADRRSSIGRSLSMSMSSAHFAALGAASASKEVLCGSAAGRIHSKVGALNLYFRQLMSQHEIIVSDIFIDFISEDSTGGGDDNCCITEVDLLLQDELPVNVIVRNIEEASFLVRPSQLVVWKFNTSAYDIGFSVEINSETKLGLTRYKCWEKPVSGSVEIGMTGVCVLRWDNSYSKLHNKSLTWCARVIDADEYNMARAEALELYRQRRRLYDQRMVVFHAAVRHAAAVSGVIHATSLNQVIQEEEFHQNRECMVKLKRVEYEKKLALSDLSNALSSIDSLVDAKGIVDVELDEVKNSLKIVEENADNLKIKYDEICLQNAELSKCAKEMSSEIGDLRSELVESTRTIDNISDELSNQNRDNASYVEINQLASRVEALEAELSASRNSYIAICQQLVDAKLETSQLASELVLAAQREDENREYIEELQNQIASMVIEPESVSFASFIKNKNFASNQVDREYSSQGRQKSMNEDDEDDDSLESSAVSEYSGYMGNKNGNRHHKKW